MPADEEFVTSSSFRADWTDETAAQYVTDYTLYVNIKQEIPVGATLLAETFYSEDVPSEDNSRDIGENNELDDYCDNAGWTGYGVYLAGGGGLKLGAGSKVGTLTTPALDLTNCGGTITVKFNARSYGSDASSVIVSCGEVADTLELTAENADYTVVLTGVNAAEAQNVTFSCTTTRKRIYLNSVTIISGDATVVRTVTETGDENSRVITGITDKYYVVEGLTAGATYTYYVEANYIDGSKVASNVETVTLLENASHDYEVGDVNHDGIVNITDVTMLIGYVLNSGGSACQICGDMNGDGNINVTDVTMIIAKVLN